MKSSKSITLVAIAFSALILGFWLNPTKSTVNLANLNATVFPEAREVKPFSLIDNKNNAFTNDELKGHWTLMFFGFTSCPYICPTTMTELNKIYTKIKHSMSDSKLQVVMVSIDPGRDTVEKMNNYVTSFNPDFRGVTGKNDSTNKLAKDMNVLALKISSNTKESNNYDIDHSASIMLINPEGKLQGIFSMPHDANEIAKEFKLIVSNVNTQGSKVA